MTNPDFTSSNPQDQLDAINLAINNTLKMQSSQVGGRSFRLAELNQLFAARNQLMMQVAFLNGTYAPTVAQIDNPDSGGINRNP